MKAILLAAGFGTRLRPLTEYVPKCLLPINGYPLIEYWIRALYDAGIHDILLNLHYLAPVMEEWLSKSAFAGHIRMVYEDPILGTGGTLLRNRGFVGNEPLILIHADNLCLADLPAYIRAHANRPPEAKITMMTFTTPTPETCGIVAIDGAGVVQAFYEKVTNPPGNLANAAVYILEPCLIDFLVGLNKPFIDFSTEVLPNYMRKIYTFHNACYHRDIGTIESFLAAQWEFPDVIRHPLDEKASWQKMCEKNNGKLSNKVLNSLARALQLEVIDLTEKDVNLSDSYTEMNGNREKAIHVLRDDMDLTPFAFYLEKSGLLKEDQIVFLREVQTGFSSKKVLMEQGLKSIALCAGVDGRKE